MNDFIIKVLKNGKNKKLYKDFCKTCLKDKGYIRKNRLNKDCHKCNSIKQADVGRNHAGKYKEVIENNRKIRLNQKITISEETKKKISVSNKATWHAKNTDITRCPEAKEIRKAFSKLLSRYLKRRHIKPTICKTKFEVLQFSPQDLYNHLESKFQSGMSWENYGEWHIDHVVADSRHRYSSTEDEEFKKSWALTNLQPLWAKDNLKKGTKNVIP